MLNDINIDKLISIIIGMSLFIISGSIHEFAHAFSAYIMGDDTAKYNGRLTINPMAHIDLFGSIIFPLFGMLSGFFFGWMRPVPVNPKNFKNSSKGYAITSFAGPFSNFIQASFGLIILKLLFVISNDISLNNYFIFSYIKPYTQLYITINIILMIFNLLPVPPLDGGGIIRYFLPPNLRNKFDNIYRFGIFILFLILLTGVLRIIFLPFFLLLGYIFNNIHNINFFIIISPFFAAILLVYIFLKEEINALIKHKKFTANYKNGEKGIQIDQVDKKEDNLDKPNKLQDILEKLNKRIDLDKNDKEFLKKISENSRNNIRLCNEIDFDINDSHCTECEYFINCLLRNMKNNKEFTN